MIPSRQNKVMSWLTTINNDLNDIESIFTNNLITTNDIDKDRHDRIRKGLNRIQCEIDDILAELDNKER